MNNHSIKGFITTNQICPQVISSSVYDSFSMYQILFTLIIVFYHKKISILGLFSVFGIFMGTFKRSYSNGCSFGQIYKFSLYDRAK